LRRLYAALVRTRTFDAKAIALQRTGRLGTYASSLGQEAVSVGVACAMQDDDVLVPSYREHGAQLWRGATPLELFLYWGGDERGSDFAGRRQDFPNCVPVGSYAPHAAGVAMAFKLRGEQVDGNDVIAVHGVVAEAVRRARGGSGPTPIEALTYRLCDHTTADDATRYRGDAEVTRHWPEEPVLRMRQYLTRSGHWTADDEDRLLHQLAAEMDDAAATYLATPAQDPATMFGYAYARLPTDLAWQREAALAATAV
jgi:TPP-dependent pyruvate/acetoin dehydrogenase alpha subunit